REGDAPGAGDPERQRDVARDDSCGARAASHGYAAGTASGFGGVPCAANRSRPTSTTTNSTPSNAAPPHTPRAPSPARATPAGREPAATPQAPADTLPPTSLPWSFIA